MYYFYKIDLKIEKNTELICIIFRKINKYIYIYYLCTYRYEIYRYNIDCL